MSQGLRSMINDKKKNVSRTEINDNKDSCLGDVRIGCCNDGLSSII